MKGLLTKAHDRFSETAIDDEIVVMNLDTGDFFSLEGTGRAAWLLIDGTRDLPGIVAVLAEQFAAPRAVMAADLEIFVAELGRAGLVAGV